MPAYHYVKTRDGSYHSGIPARDLTEEDMAALSKEQKLTVEASKLYRKVEPEPAEPERPATSEPPADSAAARRGGDR